MKKQAVSDSHGGNIYRLIEQYGMDIDEIIDFSASINPLGVPKSVMLEIVNNIKYLCNYPDPDTVRLRQELAKYLGINYQYIICGNGSTELIYLIARALMPEKVLIPYPTFSEYENAVISQALSDGSQKAKIKYLPLNEENNFDINPDEFINAMADGFFDEGRSPLTLPVDIAFLCNPNNPTAGHMGKKDVLKIASAAKDLKCYLVVDEAFIDFAPEESVIKETANNPYLIVLRSLTKFYALSGLRIGYGVFPESIIDAIKSHKEPWSVNTAAQVAAIAAINDLQYKNETFRVIQNEKKVLEDGFKLLDIDYFRSAVNFYLLKHDRAAEIAASLRNKGIMVRDCSNFRGLDSRYIRVAVKSNRDNMRLLKELAVL
jgi:threonine-phosphate decarboxylase